MRPSGTVILLWTTLAAYAGFAHAHVLKAAGEGSLGCLFLLRDVSDRVLIEDRMQRMERIISLGTLASGLHHEIKNPLTALSIHVQLLDKRLRDPETKGPVDELIGVLKTEVARLNGVLESFHDFASLRRLNRRPADVLAVLEEIGRLIAPQADRHRVEVTLRRPATELPRVALDAEKFKQAILNLVINALEAMPEGEISSSPRQPTMASSWSRLPIRGPGFRRSFSKISLSPIFQPRTAGPGWGWR